MLQNSRVATLVAVSVLSLVSTTSAPWLTQPTGQPFDAKYVPTLRAFTEARRVSRIRKNTVVLRDVVKLACLRVHVFHARPFAGESGVCG